jgi:hypothetical protein
VPPLLGVAVNVTLVPEQKLLLPSLEVMETPGVTNVPTVLVMVLLVAVLVV